MKRWALWALGFVVGLAFVVFAIGGFASELIGAYWPELGRRLQVGATPTLDNP